MISKAQHGRILLQQSFAVLFKHKKLFVLPAIGSVVDLLILAIILTPIHRFEQLQQPLTHLQYRHLFIYFLLYLIFIYFTNLIFCFANSALTSAMQQLERGEQPTLRKSLVSTSKRFGWLFLWVTFASTIGILMGLVSPILRKFKFYQKLFSGQFWGTATYFAIPILLEMNLSPLKLIAYNAELMTKMWGTPVVPRFRVIGFLILIFIPCLIPLLIGLGIGGAKAITAGVFVTAILILSINIFYLSSRTILIYKLYRFAKLDIIEPNYDKELFTHAFEKFNPN